ncbi:MAG TPA: response regulator [Rariglobus sp.]
MRILVVDDDPAIRDISARILSHAGFAVDVAADGESAWDAFLLHHYDLVVTDQNMPRLDGSGLIERVRNTGTKTPVILMTGGTTNPSSLSITPDIFLSKPFSFSVLIDAANRLLCKAAAA